MTDHRQEFWPAAAAEPPTCPKCTSKMRLAVIEPHPAPTRKASHFKFQCTCGYRLTETIEAPL